MCRTLLSCDLAMDLMRAGGAKGDTSPYGVWSSRTILAWHAIFLLWGGVVEEEKCFFTAVDKCGKRGGSLRWCAATEPKWFGTADLCLA